MVVRCASSAAGAATSPATQIVLLFLLPFASLPDRRNISVYPGSWRPGGGGDDHHPFRRDAHRAAGHASACEQYRRCWNLSLTAWSSCCLGLQLPDILSTSLVAAEAGS